ncbi:YhdP family protein [Marinobacter sp. SS21]|uniref:YhdP family protein n=1 Tax=Marinobacter sp. SS21 TaxID=2979460 RepID=UPI00232B355C|nr:YhdP family protein [Marinobacter sp. SS21]MDC0661738.1 YhdP family protein [Marinobacter sp. SS21]
MSRIDATVADAGRPITLLQRLAGLVWWLALTALILLALYAGIGRQFTENIDSYRDDLSQALSARLGQDVTIDSLSARWTWLDPIIEARGIRVASSPDHAEPFLARLDYLTIRLDSLASLLRQRVVFGEFAADGLDLALRQTDDGRILLEGLGQPASSPPSPQSISGNWFTRVGQWLSDPSVRITRVNLALRSPDQQDKHIDIPQLDLNYVRGLFSASGRAMQAGTTHQLASFSLVGQHFFRGEFTGQLHIGLNSGRLFDELAGTYQWRGLSIEGFDVGGQAWLTFRNGLMEQVSGHLEVPFLQLRAQQQSLAPLENIAFEFGWRARRPVADNDLLSGELHLRNLRWLWLDDWAEGFDLRLTHHSHAIHAYASGLPLGPLGRLASRLGVLPERANRALLGYRPEGQLDDLRLTIPTSAEGPEFGLRADLNDVSVEAFRGAPEIAGAVGTISANRRGGTVRVSGPDITLGFPLLYANSWQLAQAEATVSWLFDGPLLRVFSDAIQLRYGEQTELAEITELSGAFDLRMDRDGEDNLGLMVAVRNGTADMLATFVPSKKVAPELYQWLTTAISSAHIAEGVFYGHGQINQGAPRRSFTSSMRYRFSDGVVRYGSDWPEVEQANGTVVVHDGATEVWLDSARTGGLEVRNTRVQAVVEEGDFLVRVDTETDVPGPAVSYWLANTPLGELSGLTADTVELDGQYRLALGLEIPLSGDRDVGIRVTAETGNGELRYPGASLSWRELAGKVRFDSRSGFQASGLRGLFMGQPVRLGFDYDPSTHHFTLSQTGELSVSSFFDLLSVSPPQGAGLAGQFAYTARLGLAKGASPELSLYSSLLGTEIDWPAPLGKRSDEFVPLQAVLEPGDQGQLQLAGVWNDRLAFRVEWGDTGFERGHVVFGSQSAERLASPGLTLSGRVQRVNMDDWNERWGRLSAGAGGGDVDAAEYTEQVASWLNDITLTIAELEVLGQSFPNVRVAAGLDQDRWTIDTASSRVTGRLILPLRPSAGVEVNLASLSLMSDRSEEPKTRPAMTASEQVAAFRAMTMEGWPEVQVRIEALSMDDRPLGRWRFKLLPSAQSLHISALEGQIESLNFNGDLHWDILEGRQMSRLKGEVSGEDLGDMALLIGTQAPLRNKNSQLLLDLDWPGRPDDFKLTELEGEVSIRLDDGVILESNNTAQLFRLFNVLNADTLWRRLQLDFSDLYEAGVAFDAISGTAELRGGVLNWAPELQIVGPSGAFKLSGSSNMIDESLDMRLVVVLPLTQNLPLAALLMGASAPIGGALFVLDKVLGDPLSRLTSATYSVKGSWDQPEVRLRNVFDTGN